MSEDADVTGKRGRPEGSGFLEKPTIISFQISTETKGALKKMAVGKTVSQLIRELCEEAVKQHEAKENARSAE